jgi:hypothetical protein
MIEVVLAAALAAAVLLVVIGPRRAGRRPLEPFDPPPIEETRRGQALLALKDLDFDHATAKISDEDYHQLRERFTEDALATLGDDPIDQAEALIASRRALLEGPTGPPLPNCLTCGPRPEPDARFCSECGMRIDQRD